MLHLSKKLNEKGITLVELLAVVILTAIVSILLFSITSKALENNRIISQEAILRDEADIIVSKFIKSLYSTKQETIIRNITTGDNSYLEITNDLSKCRRDEDGRFLDLSGNPLNNDNLCKPTLKPIGFKTENGITKIHILDEQYTLSYNNIKVSPTSKVYGNPDDSSVYEIELNLEITQIRGNNKTSKAMKFKNEIQPIINSK
ncbi:MAG: prepilin-type N-terminal cleavage/methylation domain-containing protein [Psychrobacillus sp.]